MVENYINGVNNKLTMATQIEQIMDKLTHIELDLSYIKGHLTDINLTEEDKISLNNAEKDLTEGKTKRLN